MFVYIFTSRRECLTLLIWDGYRWIAFFDVVDAEFFAGFVVARHNRRASILKVARCYAIIDTVLNRNGRGRAAVTSSRFHRAIIDHVRPFGKRSEIDAGYPLNETLYRLISFVDLVEISLFTMFFINRK